MKKYAMRFNGKILLLFSSALLFSFSPLAFGQYKGNPVKKDGLVRALRSKQFQTRDIVEIIKTNGVNFRLNSAVQDELVAAGARPSVLEAVRNNYRAEKPLPAKAEIAKKGKSAFKGTPLGKNAVITLLKNDAKDLAIRRQIKQNGVSFKMNDNIAREIRAAGGKDDLIDLILASYNPSGAVDYGSVVNKPSVNNYDELIQQASYAYDNQKDLPGASAILQRAVKLSPNNPRAYQLLGFLNLYGYKNFNEAEKNWKTAINYGGSAVLRVIHDHNGVFITSCQGSLYIAQDAVRFESDDNKHTFETSDQNIKEIKVNSIFKRLVQFRQGSFKIALRKESKEDETNFSFAPLTGSTDESKMIIRLIGKK